MKSSVPFMLLLAVTIAAAVPALAPGEEPATGAEPAPASDPVHAQPKISAEDVQRDLELRLARTDDGDVLVGSLPTVALEMHNGSETAAHHIVLPGDGSEVGWREPHLRFAVERLGADGKWSTLAQQGIGRCGLFDAWWTEDIVRLAPGESRKFENWVDLIAWSYDLTRTGHHRVRATYAFRRNPATPREGGDGDTTLGAMEAYAAHEIHSNWIEFDLSSPLEVEIVRAEPLVFHGKHRAASVFLVRVSNVSSETLTIDPDLVNAWLSARTTQGASAVESQAVAGSERDPIQLEPGDHLPLFGSSGLTSQRTTVLATGTPPEPGEEHSVELALLIRVQGERQFTVRSNEVTLRVVAGE